MGLLDSLLQENTTLSSIMGSAVSTVAKPVMRGMHVAQIKKILIGATVFSTVTSVAWYMMVNKPRKEAYKNFYANYDADAEFERMKAGGIFQSQAIIDEKMGE